MYDKRLGLQGVRHKLAVVHMFLFHVHGRHGCFITVCYLSPANSDYPRIGFVFSQNITTGFCLEIKTFSNRSVLYITVHSHAGTGQRRLLRGNNRKGETVMLQSKQQLNAGRQYKAHNVANRFRAQELCESRGGRPGLPALMKPMVSVDVEQHFSQQIQRSGAV